MRFANLADILTLSLPALDVLVNNAAIAGPEPRTYTGDGHELTFQVNHLAAYLLTTKLVPKLVSAGGRVVNVSSAKGITNATGKDYRHVVTSSSI